MLGKLYKKIEKLSRPHPNLLGTKTVFGLMPDWNPAEIIGVRPRKLALSLYKELITDSIWAHQRSNYGYRNLIGHPLLVTFAGVPYVDVRITFNSFIPSNLHENIAKKLMEYYMDKLIAKPKYHDKVEF
ncbi:MAG: phosphoenolpyruvate synthase, partial [Eubacteriales bacterium]